MIGRSFFHGGFVPAPPSVAYAGLDLSPATSLGRGPVVEALRPLAPGGLSVWADDDLSPTGLRAQGPVGAVMAALVLLRSFGEGVAVRVEVADGRSPGWQPVPVPGDD